MALILSGSTGVTTSDGTPAVAAGSIGSTELASTAVTAGTYGSSSAIPSLTVDADGRITNVTTNNIPTGVSLTLTISSTVSTSCSWGTLALGTHKHCTYYKHDVYSGGCDHFSYVTGSYNGSWEAGVYRGLVQAICFD